MIQTKPVIVKLQLVQSQHVNEETGQDEDRFFVEFETTHTSPLQTVGFTCVQIDPQMYARLKRSLCLEDE